MTSQRGRGLTLEVESTVDEVMVVEASLMVALDGCSPKGPDIIGPAPRLYTNTHTQAHR